MKSRRNHRRNSRRFEPDAFMIRPAQIRSAAEIDRVSKILAEIEKPNPQPERIGIK